jgi:hypothetical protein
LNVNLDWSDSVGFDFCLDFVFVVIMFLCLAAVMEIPHNFIQAGPIELPPSHLASVDTLLDYLFSVESSSLLAAETDMCRLLGRDYKNVATALAIGVTCRWVGPDGVALNSLLKAGAINGSKIVFAGRPLGIVGSSAHVFSITAQNPRISAGDGDDGEGDGEMADGAAAAAAAALVAARAASSVSAAASAAASLALANASALSVNATAAAAAAVLAFASDTGTAAQVETATANATRAARALPGVALAANATAKAAEAAAANVQFVAQGGHTDADIVSLQHYCCFAKSMSVIAKTPTEKLLKTAPRVSEAVKTVTSSSAGFVANSEAIGDEAMLEQFTTMRFEAAFRLCNSQNVAAKLASAKRAARSVLQKLLSRPLHVVSRNADLQLRQFKVKLAFWSKFIQLVQAASKQSRIRPFEKIIGMRFAAAQLQILFLGATQILPKNRATQAAQFGRSCAFIPRTALPQPLVVFMREQWRSMAGDFTEQQETEHCAAIGVTIPAVKPHAIVNAPPAQHVPQPAVANIAAPAPVPNALANNAAPAQIGNAQPQQGNAEAVQPQPQAVRPATRARRQNEPPEDEPPAGRRRSARLAGLGNR